MPKVLTVDDSRAVRMLVSKNAKEMGLEVEEAVVGLHAAVEVRGVDEGRHPPIL